MLGLNLLEEKAKGLFLTSKTFFTSKNRINDFLLSGYVFSTQHSMSANKCGNVCLKSKESGIIKPFPLVIEKRKDNQISHK